jgi:hypothetical protein
MKKITLIALSCFTLGACDTINSISMPTMGLFEKEQSAKSDSLEDIAVQAQKQIEPSTPSKAGTSSALETELKEMEMLTGTRLQVISGTTPVADELSTEENLQQTDLPIEVSEPKQVAEIAPEIKVEPTEEIAQTEEIKPIKDSVEKIEADQVPTPPAPESISDTAVINPVEVNEKIEIVEPVIVEQVRETAPIVPEPTPLAVETPKLIEPMTADEKPIFTESDLKLSSAEGCPQIEIMPAARSITYFADDISSQITARASISEIRGGCEVVSGGMEIDLDILMKGTITNKGRFEGNVNEEAFMTFPYFVTVSIPQGLPVDKQILATAMRFRPLVDYLDHAEKITQFIPMDNTNVAANYTITIGYQLTRKQLDYNRAVAASRPNDNRASPDTLPARRLSINPLAE